MPKHISIDEYLDIIFSGIVWSGVRDEKISSRQSDSTVRWIGIER